MTAKYWFMDLKIDQNTVVVFDLDDTLYNEIEYLKSAYQHIAKKVDPHSWQSLHAIMFSLYRSGSNVFDYLINERSCIKEDLLDHYRYHSPAIEPFPGVLDLFADIKKNGGKLALVTDGRSVTQRNKIKALGLEPYLDHIVISEEIGTEKPHTNNFLSVEKAFNRTCHYYIADNIRKDFDGPHELGWQGILLADNGLNIHQNPLLNYKIEKLNLTVILSIQELRVVS